MNATPPLHLRSDPQWEAHLDEARLLRAIQTVFQVEEVPEGSHLSLVIVGDEEMSRLHEAYRSEAGTTDVLSFPYEDDGVDEEMAGYLGDVIICYEQAARQGEAEGHSAQDEVDLLAIHGALHLLGYDDETPDEKARMWARQRTILSHLGLDAIAP